MTIIAGEAGWDDLLPAMQAGTLTDSQRARLADAHSVFATQIPKTIHLNYKEPATGLVSRYGSGFEVAADGASVTYPVAIGSFLSLIGSSLDPIVTHNALTLEACAYVALVEYPLHLTTVVLVFTEGVELAVDCAVRVVTTAGVEVDGDAITFVLIRTDVSLTAACSVVDRLPRLLSAAVTVQTTTYRSAEAVVSVYTRHNVSALTVVRIVNDPEPEQWNFSVSADDADVLLTETDDTLTTDG